MSRSNVAEGYIVLVPNIDDWGYGPRLRGVRIDRVRSGKPSLERGEIAFKLRLTFDEKALLEAIPVIDLDVSAFVSGPTEPATVEATA
jgi:hypothetical protein